MTTAVYVIATTFDGTRAAVAAAIPLAKGSNARLVVLVPRVVSYAVDLDGPIEGAAFFAKRYEAIVHELGGTACVQVCLCRSLDDIVAMVAAAQSQVVVGGPAGRWLTSPEERFATRLIRAGCRLLFAASGTNSTQRRSAASAAAFAVLAALLLTAANASAQDPPAPPTWQYGAFIDVGTLLSAESPANHLFRNRGTTPRVDEIDVDMAAAYLRTPPTESSRLGVELTTHGGEDAKLFGFSATAPNLNGADVLLHLGPTNVSYLAPAGKGLTIQGGIFNSLIGYDSLYAKDNFTYTRPWGADYTPYLMLGVNAAYPLSDRLTITGAVINGYWHLAHANDAPNVVGQIAFKASDLVTVKETVLTGSHQPNTALEFWRVFSDTIVERKAARLTTAVEYQLSAEQLDDPGNPNALWMSGQVIAHWIIRGPLSATVRPEFCWDRDGRWTGFAQRVVAVTAGAEYRVPFRGAQAILRGEYRIDDSRGDGGGFFAGADDHLTPTQNLFVAALILTFDGTVRR